MASKFLLTLRSYESQCKTESSFALKKKKKHPWLVWLSDVSVGLRTKGLPVQFAVRAHAWVVGQIPQ